MKLTTNHRGALIEELKKAIEQKGSISYRLNSETAKKDLAIMEWWQIEDYLNNRRLEMIEDALKDEEIDY